jgi:tetratricopeptide (TPR) repeat protein
MLMGYAFKEIGLTDNAIDCFRNSLNINPDFIESHIQLGQIFHLLGDSTALTYYNNALKLEPLDQMVLYNKALFFQSQLDWNNALEAYNQLHKVNPFHANGHYNLGFIHMELELYDLATNNFSDAIYSDSEFYEAYYSRGNCFETAGNVLQAESDYKRAIEINPKYVYALEALDNLRIKNKRYNK